MSIFNQVEHTRPNSNTFDLSHDRKMSLKMGELVPIHCQEIIPGDQITMSTSQMIRMAPMIAPVMHRVNVYTHFFFVPNRLLWDNWEAFITGGEDGLDTSVFPQMTVQTLGTGTVGDYLGLPTTDEEEIQYDVSALPIAAYAKIYDEFYRDQNLIDPIFIPLGDGFGPNEDYEQILQGAPLKRAWAHDYFTSALPWTQKGAEATIPLGTSAPIRYTADQGIWETTFRDQFGDSIDDKPAQTIGTSPNGTPEWSGTTGDNINIDISQAHDVDLSQATASTINDLRRAFKLQEWLEKNARGGSRYIESILVHFGVKSSDARLQRPEFLGGGKSPVTISEVLQTSTTQSEPTPQGNMAGHGISVGANHSFTYGRAEEHGYIIGIMSIMPKTAYFQGIPKHFLKFDKFQYYWPSFAHIGEQPIYNKELFIQADETDDDIFGYTPRYAEYKHMLSSVHGEFRTTLDFWHMARKFENQPQLNEDFINADPTTRIFAVENSETIYCHLFHRIKARRLMPYFGNPSM